MIDIIEAYGVQLANIAPNSRPQSIHKIQHCCLFCISRDSLLCGYSNLNFWLWE